MEIYLKEGKYVLRFPVTPSVISVESSANIGTKNIIKLGEIPTFGGRKLRKIDLASFFPRQAYEFCNYKNFKDAYVYADKLGAWLVNGTVLRLVIPGTNINFECTISDFEQSEKDGTGDVYFSLSLVEYRRITIPKYNNVVNGGNKPNPTPPPPKPVQKIHVVKKGDNLWDISKKYYGKGSLYPKIKEKNKKTYPSLAKNNIIYPNWKLVL